MIYSGVLLFILNHCNINLGILILIILNFSWARTWQCFCVSVCLYVLQVLVFGGFREGINRQICLKFGTHIAWLFFIFWKMWFWDPGDPVLDPKWTENLWSTQGKCHKWSNLSEICYTYSSGESLGVFLSFFENFDFWALRDSALDPKWTENLHGILGKEQTVKSLWNLAYV